MKTPKHLIEQSGRTELHFYFGYEFAKRWGLQCWDIPRFFGGIREVGISQLFVFMGYPKCDKNGRYALGAWDIPTVTKDGLPESVEEVRFGVITVLQITTPPYGLIIDLSI